MAAFHPATLYPIVDVKDGDAREAFERADAAMGAGASWLQLRVKTTPAREHLELARALVERAASFAARVIVNDRLDIALASGAGGVHLGQTDLPAAAVRPLASAHGLVLGISTHDTNQATKAEALGADYIGFGPMFPTGSKANALEPRAAGALAAVRDAVQIPIVAIGGITEATAGAVLAQGADAVAVIGALATAPDPAAFSARILRLEDQSS